MGKILNRYKKIVGSEKIKEIEKRAKPLKGKYILHINATYYGGGVAEILDNLVVLMNDVGINACWSIIKGSEPFFEITKTFHNGTQGYPIKLTKEVKATYEELCRRNSVYINFCGADAVIAHDPQVLPLIKYARPDRKKEPWVWRIHTDITQPDPDLWNYLKTFIKNYNEMVVSDEKYLKDDIGLKQTIIMPSIDPLSKKNRDLSDKQARKILKDAGIDLKKPMICQISRYDRWKDQVGVVEAFKRIKKEVDCQLVLLGNYATDDPEGAAYYKKTKAKAKGLKDIKVIADKGASPLLVNALQKMSEVVIQKSLREGFGLTVSEALWKRTPVVAGNVGGIPSQIKHGENGFLVNSVKQCAEKTIELLKDDKLRKKMGKNGREYVRENFLITRHLLDYLELLNRIIK
ncbi:glycosyltransferase [Candidatus Falkowbacteria bacterium]|nr:glycosyltransferase [Candidatus Falkowbacteria bacterium]